MKRFTFLAALLLPLSSFAQLIISPADSSGGGGGTVTSASIVTANGVSGTTATATTTPAHTITLGAITPSSVTTPTLTSTGALALSSAANGHITLVPNGTGRVGIGTAAPSDTALVISAPNSHLKLIDSDDDNYVHLSYSSDLLAFRINGITGPPVLGLTDVGGVSIGTATDAGAGNLLVNNVIYAKATSGALTPPTDSAGIRAKNDPAELYSVDEAGNETLLSPHAGDAPAAFYDPADLMPHLVKEIQVFAGTVRYQNFTRQGRLSELTSAERDALPVAKRRCIFVETFAQHLTRTGEDLNLGDTPAEKTAWAGLTPSARWDNVQEKQRVRRVAERAAWQARKDANPTITDPQPVTYVPKVKPARLP